MLRITYPSDFASRGSVKSHFAADGCAVCIPLTEELRCCVPIESATAQLSLFAFRYQPLLNRFIPVPADI